VFLWIITSQHFREKSLTDAGLASGAKEIGACCEQFA
jgi:hypothetical protein